MARDRRTELLQGTLDMLILRTLQLGPAHGHEIAKHIQRTSDDVLQVEHGSLYPALHRLEQKGWHTDKWEMANDRNREFKYYRLTATGKKSWWPKSRNGSKSCRRCHCACDAACRGELNDRLASSEAQSPGR